VDVKSAGKKVGAVAEDLLRGFGPELDVVGMGQFETLAWSQERTERTRIAHRLARSPSSRARTKRSSMGRASTQWR
jgi:hypothetical protein